MRYRDRNLKFKKTNRWMVDYDYTQKLDLPTLDWLAKFSNEYYENNFGQEPLHDKDGQKKCTNTDNARRRCVYNIQDSGNAILKLSALTDIHNMVKSHNPEDAIIEMLDQHKARKGK